MPVSARIITLFAIASAGLGLAITPSNANPGFAQASRMPCASCHMPGQETEAPNAGFTPQGFQVYTSFRGACNYRMDCAIGAAFGTNAPPPPPQFGYGNNAQAPAYNAPPPAYPPPAYSSMPPQQPPADSFAAPQGAAPASHTSRYYNGRFDLTSRCPNGPTWYWARSAAGGNDQFFTIMPGQIRTVSVSAGTIGSYSCAGVRTGYSSPVYPIVY